MSQNNNWNNVRGKKMKLDQKKKNIDFDKVEKKILFIVSEELAPYSKDSLNVPNKYCSWIIK